MRYTCMLCWSQTNGFQRAPQSRTAVPQNTEALPNLATTVTVDWNVKQKQTNK